MQIHVIDHPLITQKLSLLRDKKTPSALFRQLVEELVILLAYEATKGIKTEITRIETPVGVTNGLKLSTPRPIIVPILRAGLGMLDGMLKIIPTAEVGFLGIKRNEVSLIPYAYANRLPDDLQNRQVIIVDPMLATGGTLTDSIDFVLEKGATDVTCICLIASPEGLAAVEHHVGTGDVKIFLGALDEKLNEKGYIIPGLGDAGDRLYGLAD